MKATHKKLNFWGLLGWTEMSYKSFAVGLPQNGVFALLLNSGFFLKKVLGEVPLLFLKKVLGEVPLLFLKKVLGEVPLLFLKKVLGEVPLLFLKKVLGEVPLLFLKKKF